MTMNTEKIILFECLAKGYHII